MTSRLHELYIVEGIFCPGYTCLMPWVVEFDATFRMEFRAMPAGVRREIVAMSRILRDLGPMMGRPQVDTLNGSRHANMKELRFNADNGVWRVAFAFDPNRQAILLVAGDKSGVSERRFYRELIRKADERFDGHLDRLREERSRPQ